MRFVWGSLVAAALLANTGAFANEFCDKELGPLIQERKVLTGRLSAIGKNGQAEGARDKFCGTLNTYIGNIKKTLTYLEQNKEFCGVPDDAIDQARKGLAQNQTLRKRVCLGPPPQAAGAPQGNRAPVLRPPVELRLQ